MRRPLTLWIVIADGEHARFVYPDRDNVLRTMHAVDAAFAHRRASDIVTDRRGRSFEGASPARHGVSDRHDPHFLEKQRFALLIAEQLNEASDRDDFDKLLLVAAPDTLHELRQGLDATAAEKLVGSLEKDLCKTPDHELWPHLRQWVSPERHAVAWPR